MNENLFDEDIYFDSNNDGFHHSAEAGKPNVGERQVNYEGESEIQQ